MNKTKVLNQRMAQTDTHEKLHSLKLSLNIKHPSLISGKETKMEMGVY